MTNRIFFRLKGIGAVIVLIAAVTVVSVYQYVAEADRIDRESDARLLAAARTARHLVGDPFHDALPLHPPSPREDMNNIRALSRLAQDIGVQYIYTIILDGNKTLRFTSSSATPDELRTGKKLTRYFDTYDYYPKMIAALKTGKIVYDKDNDSDAWGSLRSIFVPYTTPHGVTYLIGADIDNLSLQRRIHTTILIELMKFVLVLASAVPLLWLYRRSLLRTNRRLRRLVDKATRDLRLMNRNLEHLVEEKTRLMLAQAMIDTLTGLPNRIRLQNDLSRHTPATLALINIDDFKEVNNFFGVAAGDDVIRQFAHWLTAFAMTTYRLNGDEFVIYLTDTDHDAVAKIFRTMLERLEQTTFQSGDEMIVLTVTIGIAIGDDNLLGHADVALQYAKNNRQPIVFYKEVDYEQQAKAHLILCKEIRDALHASRIVCYYQPVVDSRTDAVTSYETLVRMVLEDGTVVPPNDFLKVAQRTKLYPDITKTVIRQACATFAARPESFSVNLSVGDILNEEIVDYIETVTEETGTVRRIVFEILESEGIENYPAVLAFIRRMKARGAAIAIDDFGTGYSSFENILKLDVDYIKIDGSLIKNIDHEPRSAVVVGTIVDFAHKIGARTVAEYVASEPIAQRVKQLGVDFLQGYYFGIPRPAHALTPPGDELPHQT